MISIALYVLISVSNDGKVSSSNYPTRAVCEDAASIATTGKTVAEQAEVNRKAHKASQEREVTRFWWYAYHPWHKANTDNERKAFVERYSGGELLPIRRFNINTDGLIREMLPLDRLFTGIYIPDPPAFKYVRCLADK